MRARESEQFGDEALLGGILPPIWMPYWSEPAKRDTARMEQGREMLRTRDLPFIEKTLGNAAAGGYLCGQFSVADLPAMALAMVLDVDQMKLDAFPKVAEYLARLRQRPSYRAISPHTKVAEAAERG